MSDTNLSRVDAFLANLSSKQQQQPQPQRGSLIFAIDATGSREQAWDSAAELQVQMFKEAALLGGIDVQLVYYRGTQGFDAECKASRLGRQSDATSDLDVQDSLQGRQYTNLQGAGSRAPGDRQAQDRRHGVCRGLF